MLICYDMVFPEAARCLALGGADVIFHPTLGGAATMSARTVSPSCTWPAMTSLLSGMPPATHGIRVRVP